MPTALITGAGGGLGAAIADALAPTHTLLLAGRASKRLDGVCERLGAAAVPLDELTVDHRSRCLLAGELMEAHMGPLLAESEGRDA